MHVFQRGPIEGIAKPEVLLDDLSGLSLDVLCYIVNLICIGALCRTNPSVELK